MNIKDKRTVGEILGRSGIAERIVQLANDIAAGTYKNAMERAGQISALVEAATFDEYWTEKATVGKYKEEEIFRGLIDGELIRDRVAHFVNPYNVK